MKIITLPSGKKVSLGVYVKVWKALKAMTQEQRSNIQDYTWNWHANNGNDILRAIRRGCQDRINLRGQKA